MATKPVTREKKIQEALTKEKSFNSSASCLRIDPEMYGREIEERPLWTPPQRLSRGEGQIRAL